jgi:hypothetical protein|tara:strand:+ start:6362 stop:7651 length:1290 start_codon:yes stop_codon:yes gene_type:complete
MSKDCSNVVGNQIPTPAGGVLTVVGYTKNVRKQCRCYCSICSEDTELFPDKYFYVNFSALNNGRFPCGCTNYKWNKEQYEVRVKRRCRELGYEFLGFEGWDNHKTKINLYNPSTGNIWDTTSINQFLSKKTVDPVEGRMLNKIGSSKEDDYHIELFFKSGSFKDGTIFSRSLDKDKGGWYPYWNYKCPVCSKDEYVKAGVCSGIFKGSSTHLKNGKLSCRCAKSYRWSREQREYQILKQLDKCGGKFISWATQDYKNDSMFNWECSEGHLCNTSVDKFLGVGRRCPTCATVNMNFGYYANRVDEVDYLYVYKIEELPYIKIGRTFNPERRLKENVNRILDYYGEDFSLTLEQTLFTAKHGYVYEKEQELLGNTEYNIFSKNKYSVEDSYGSSELLDESMYQFVLDNLREDNLIEEVKPVEKTVIVYGSV